MDEFFKAYIRQLKDELDDLSKLIDHVGVRDVHEVLFELSSFGSYIVDLKDVLLGIDED